MIRTLAFATLCVAVFAQTDPPKYHDLNNRVARDAEGSNNLMDRMTEFTDMAAKSTADAVNGAKDVFNSAVFLPAERLSDVFRNERHRRFAQQQSPDNAPSTTPGQPPQPK